MTTKNNVLLLFGGGHSEHEISRKSASTLEIALKDALFNVYKVELKYNDGRYEFIYENSPVDLIQGPYLQQSGEKISLNGAVICVHGPPGETGDLSSFCNLINLPTIGANAEAHSLCFNKISTKLWATSQNIQTAPYIFLHSLSEIDKAYTFFEKHQDIFVKASHQGSSVGCYHVSQSQKLEEVLRKAFELSPFVLLEETLRGRELEVALYQFNGEWKASLPGEIHCPDKFYTYEEKYLESQTTVSTVANLTQDEQRELQAIAIKISQTLKIRHFCRVDFFLTSKGIFLNEINTLPGMTAISLFPKMLEANGILLKDFLSQLLREVIS